MSCFYAIKGYGWKIDLGIFDPRKIATVIDLNLKESGTETLQSKLSEMDLCERDVAEAIIPRPSDFEYHRLQHILPGLHLCPSRNALELHAWVSAALC